MGQSTDSSCYSHGIYDMSYAGAYDAGGVQQMQAMYGHAMPQDNIAGSISSSQMGFFAPPGFVQMHDPYLSHQLYQVDYSASLPCAASSSYLYPPAEQSYASSAFVNDSIPVSHGQKQLDPEALVVKLPTLPDSNQCWIFS